MKIYVTKYALTEGIQEMEAEESLHTDPMAVVRRKGTFDLYFHRKDWHPTREAAVIQANAMVAKKIKSIEKQMAKLKTLKFE